MLNFFNIWAGDEARTRDLQLGRLSLYQLSYTRLFIYRIFSINTLKNHTDFSVIMGEEDQIKVSILRIRQFWRLSLYQSKRRPGELHPLK